MTLLLALLALSPVQDADRIQDLIRKLGSEDYATREQATEDLKKIGPPARAALQQAAAESEDPEVRQRAQELLDDKPKPGEKPAPKKAVPVPGRPGLRGSSVSVRTVNGDSTYTIRPAEDLPALTFHKSAAGRVKLESADEKAESESLEAFLKDHAELARKFGITANGIDYGGSRVSFNGPAMPGFTFPAPRFPLPDPPRRVPPPRQEEGTLVDGVALEPVDDAVRSQLDLPEGQGAVVLRVAPGSVAEALGLKKNDILLEVDGRRIESAAPAKGWITRESRLTLLRKGKKETLGGRKDF